MLMFYFFFWINDLVSNKNFISNKNKLVDKIIFKHFTHKNKKISNYLLTVLKNSNIMNLAFINLNC